MKISDDTIMNTTAVLAVICVLALIFTVMGWGVGIVGAPIRIGAAYVDSTEGMNPFVAHTTNTILDVKDGYVLYRTQNGELRTTSKDAFRRENTKISGPPRAELLPENQ